LRLGTAARVGGSSGTSKPAPAGLEPRPSAPKGDDALAAGRPLRGVTRMGRARATRRD